MVLKIIEIDANELKRPGDYLVMAKVVISALVKEEDFKERFVHMDYKMLLESMDECVERLRELQR